MSLRISSVVVMEDRAQIDRRGTVTLPGGVTTIELPGMPLVAVDRSLAVECTGAVVHEARLARRWKERPPGGVPADASELRKRLEVLAERAAQHDADVFRLGTRKDVLSDARAQLLTSIAARAGYGDADAPQWAAQLDAVSAAQRENDEAMRHASDAAAATKLELASSKRALTLAEQRVEDQECALVLTLEGSGECQLAVSFLVPCAVWRPAYRASLSGTTVSFESEAVVWQRTGEAWADVKLSFATTRPTLGTAPPTLTDDWLSLRPKTATEQRQVEVSVREEVIQTAGEASSGPPELPGLDDGGEARLLVAPHRATIPSDGQPHRVPLSRFDADATLELVCPAELSPLAFTVASFKNAGDTVLLAGPVDLIRAAGFVGRSVISFTAPGETLKLSFGSDDGVRVTRTFDERVDEKLLGRRTTRRLITLFVSNANPAPRRLALEERVFVSEVKDVEVQVLTKDCSPSPSAPSKDGIVRIELDLEPNATKKVKFTWEVNASSKVAGL